MSLIRIILVEGLASASASRLGRAAGMSTYWSHLPSFTSFSRYFIYAMQSLVACPRHLWNTQYFVWSILKVCPFMGCGILNHGLSLMSQRIWLIRTQNLVYTLGVEPHFAGD
ncbi:hypothetical protein ACFX11_038378 [Malus domestica]